MDLDGDGEDDRGDWANESEIVIDAMTVYSSNLLRFRLKTDAYEHYLFIQAYVKQISDIWSPIILFLGIISILLLMVLVARVWNDSYASGADYIYIGGTFLIFGVVAIFPLSCIAYANGATTTIRDCFRRYSTPTNYDIIGGREAWMEYIEESPAYWTVFGFPLTWGSLYSVIGTFLGSVVILGISYIRAGGGGVGASS